MIRLGPWMIRNEYNQHGEPARTVGEDQELRTPSLLYEDFVPEVVDWPLYGVFGGVRRVLGASRRRLGDLRC